MKNKLQEAKENKDELGEKVDNLLSQRGNQNPRDVEKILLKYARAEFAYGYEKGYHDATTETRELVEDAQEALIGLYTDAAIDQKWIEKIICEIGEFLKKKTEGEKKR